MRGEALFFSGRAFFGPYFFRKESDGRLGPMRGNNLDSFRQTL